MTPLPSVLTWLEGKRHKPAALVFDIDGVLAVRGTPLPGAATLIEQVRAAEIPFTLLTNDTHLSKAEKGNRLHSAGIPVTAGDIVSAGDALSETVSRLALFGKAAFVMGTLGTPDYAAAAGLSPTRAIADLPRCDAIVVGEEEYDWEPVIHAVINHLMKHPETPLIVPNPDIFSPRPRGTVHIEPGGVAAWIQSLLRRLAVDILPEYLGKPHPPIFRANHRLLTEKAGRGIDPAETLMIGDYIDADIRGAKAFGYQAALVLTGVSKQPGVSFGEDAPDLVFEHL
jgi:HAD superfamily hydrolase (TIGR01450 family)